jgi:F0F1-type ATP synthase alpha subunit
MKYTIIVAATASEAAPLQYVIPMYELHVVRLVLTS